MSHLSDDVFYSSLMTISAILTFTQILEGGLFRAIEQLDENLKNEFNCEIPSNCESQIKKISAGACSHDPTPSPSQPRYWYQVQVERYGPQ